MNVALQLAQALLAADPTAVAPHLAAPTGDGLRQLFIEAAYLAASVLFIFGLRGLTTPDKARRGMQLARNVTISDEADVIAHVKAHLAHYKAPKRVLVVDTIGRAPNGKVDYKRHLEESLVDLGIAPSPIPVANA